MVLEGDSKVVMDALADEAVSLSSYGLLIADAKSLSLDFFQLCYSYVRREGNKVSHSLARCAVTVFDFIVGMKSAPPQVDYVY